MVREKGNVPLLCGKGIFARASPAASWWERQGFPGSLSQGGAWGLCCLRPPGRCR